MSASKAIEFDKEQFLKAIYNEQDINEKFNMLAKMIFNLSVNEEDYVKKGESFKIECDKNNIDVIRKGKSFKEEFIRVSEEIKNESMKKFDVHIRYAKNIGWVFGILSALVLTLKELGVIK